MNAMKKRSGQYLGTKIEDKWWRRYTKGGFFTRGKGKYWIKDGSLFFQHHAGQMPIRLPLCNLIEIEVRPSQAWGVSVLKLVWLKDGNRLSSSFALTGATDETPTLLTSLRIGA